MCLLRNWSNEARPLGADLAYHAGCHANLHSAQGRGVKL